MTRSGKLLTVLFLFFLSISAQAQDNAKTFRDLNSLTGKWSMESSKGMLYESWLKLNDSTFKGLSFRVSGKDTTVLEQMELVLREGRIMFIPTVPGQNNEKPVVFTLARLENDGYIFENKEHDFPKRVVYVLPKANTLHAWIEGNINGEARKIDFKFKKVE
ncbi:MAG TPA: DUF6265 family protein [Flavisolibacter sp.]|jgi:hypothetical protein